MIAPVSRTFFAVLGLLVSATRFACASDRIDHSDHHEERREFGRMILSDDEIYFERRQQWVLRELESFAMEVMSMSMSIDMAPEASSRKRERRSR